MTTATTTRQDSTARILRRMLQENTGRHMLDSGGAYGRNWERNQAHAFEKEPATVFTVGEHGIEVTHSLYHWLREKVTYRADWQARFNRYARKFPDEGWLGLMEGFVDSLPLVGNRGTVNSYNGEDLLSQVIQYTYFEVDGDSLVLLQIHGGCDVRGGYTKPRVFQIDEYGLMHNADATICCQGRDDPAQTAMVGHEREQHYWSTDDANNFYYQGTAGHGAGTQLEDYNRCLLGEGADWKAGVLCYFEDGKALCPKCGGALVAGF